MNTKQRKSVSELRQAVLAAGVGLIAEEGLATGVERITLERAIRRAEVPRASAYRAWSQRDRPPQEAFQRDLLAALAADRDSIELIGESTVSAVTDVLSLHGDIQNLTPADRGRILQQAIRAGTRANLEALRQSPTWGIYVGVAAAVSSRDSSPSMLDEHDGSLREALADGEVSEMRMLLEMYSGLLLLFGLRIREPYELGQFAAAAAALLDGILLRMPYNPHLRDFDRATGSGQALEQWTLFGMAFEGLVKQFVEPDPAAEIRTDLP